MKSLVDLLAEPSGGPNLGADLANRWGFGFFATQVDVNVAGTFTTGTAPFKVSSQRKVANLNVDFLDDKDWATISLNISCPNSVRKTGDLSTNLILDLVGDVNAPPAGQYYGTGPATTAKGWYALPTIDIGTGTIGTLTKWKTVGSKLEDSALKEDATSINSSLPIWITGVINRFRQPNLANAPVVAANASGDLIAATFPAPPTVTYGITQPAKGFTVSGSPNQQSPGWNWVFALADDLGALEGITGQGYVKRAGTDAVPTYSTVLPIPWSDITGFPGILSISLTAPSDPELTISPTLSAGAYAATFVFSGDLRAVETITGQGYAKRGGTEGAPTWSTLTKIPWADVDTPLVGVTNVDLSVDGIKTHSVFLVDSPAVTSTGFHNITLQSQTANTFWAAPSGAAGKPGFRAITLADLPAPPVDTDGLGQYPYVARWNSATSLGKGLLQDDGSTLGHGVAPAAAYAFRIVRPWATTGSFYGISVSLNRTIGDATGVMHAFSSSPTISSPAPGLSQYYDFNASPVFSGAGNTGQVFGVRILGSISAGRITNRYAYYASPIVISGTGDVTEEFGFTCANLSLGVTAPGRRAAFWGAVDSDVGNVQRWNLYMSGSAVNYLAGNLGIGKQNPAIALDVVGAGFLTSSLQAGFTITAGMTATRPGGVQLVTTTVADNVPGYAQFIHPADSVRRGFIGFASGTNIVLQSEQGWGIYINGPAAADLTVNLNHIANKAITSAALVTGLDLRATSAGMQGKMFIGTKADGTLEERVLTLGTIGAVGGTGAVNTLAKWTPNTTTLGNSSITDVSGVVTANASIVQVRSTDPRLSIYDTDSGKNYKRHDFIIQANNLFGRFYTDDGETIVAHDWFSVTRTTLDSPIATNVTFAGSGRPIWNQWSTTASVANYNFLLASGNLTTNVLPRATGVNIIGDSGVIDDDNALTVNRRVHTRYPSLNANYTITSSQCEWWQHSVNTDPTRYYRLATFTVAANYGTLGSKAIFEVHCGQYQSHQRTSYYIEMGDRLSSSNPMRYYVRAEGAIRDQGSGIQVYAESTGLGANTYQYHVYLYTLNNFYTGTMVTAKNTGYARSSVVFFPNPAVETTPVGNGTGTITLDFDTTTCTPNVSCFGYNNGATAAGGTPTVTTAFTVNGSVYVKDPALMGQSLIGCEAVTGKLIPGTGAAGALTGLGIQHYVARWNSTSDLRTGKFQDDTVTTACADTYLVNANIMFNLVKAWGTTVGGTTGISVQSNRTVADAAAANIGVFSQSVLSYATGTQQNHYDFAATPNFTGAGTTGTAYGFRSYMLVNGGVVQTRNAFYATSATVNSGSLASEVGFTCENLSPGNVRYGFRSQVNAAGGTSRYNVYADGDAPSLFSGEVTVKDLYLTNLKGQPILGTDAITGKIIAGTAPGGGITGSGTRNNLVRWLSATTVGQGTTQDNNLSVTIGVPGPLGDIALNSRFRVDTLTSALTLPAVGYGVLTNFTDDDTVALATQRYSAAFFHTKSGSAAHTGQTIGVAQVSAYNAGSEGSQTGFYQALSMAAGASLTNYRAFMADRNYTAYVSGTKGIVVNRYGLYVNDYNSINALTVTNNYGVSVIDQTNSANVYGFHSTIIAGATKWGLYFSGSVQNYLQGNLGIGVSVASEKLDVVGNAEISGTISAWNVNEVIGFSKDLASGGAAQFWKIASLLSETDTGQITVVALDMEVEEWNTSMGAAAGKAHLDVKVSSRGPSGTGWRVTYNVRGTQIPQFVGVKLTRVGGAAPYTYNLYAYLTGGQYCGFNVRVRTYGWGNKHTLYHTPVNDGTTPVGTSVWDSASDTPDSHIIGLTSLTAQMFVAGKPVVTGATALGTQNRIPKWLNSTSSDLTLSSLTDDGVTVDTPLWFRSINTSHAGVVISAGSPSLLGFIDFMTTPGKYRWRLMRNGSAEAGSDAGYVGSDFQLQRWTDAAGIATGIGSTVMLITRATGFIRFGSAVAATEMVDVTGNTKTSGSLIAGASVINRMLQVGPVFFASDATASWINQDTRINGDLFLHDPVTPANAAWFDATTAGGLALKWVGGMANTLAVTGAITATTTITAQGVVTGSGLRASLLTSKTFIGTDGSGNLEERTVTPGTIGAVDGSGTINTIPRWVADPLVDPASATLGDSAVSDNGTLVNSTRIFRVTSTDPRLSLYKTDSALNHKRADFLVATDMLVGRFQSDDGQGLQVFDWLTVSWLAGSTVRANNIIFAADGTISHGTKALAMYSTLAGGTTNFLPKLSGSDGHTFVNSAASDSGTLFQIASPTSLTTTLTVGTNATVGGTLGVTGLSTLASLLVSGSATVSGNLGVTGTSTLTTVNASGVITGAGIADTTVTSAVLLGTTIAGRLIGKTLVSLGIPTVTGTQFTLPMFTSSGAGASLGDSSLKQINSGGSLLFTSNNTGGYFVVDSSALSPNVGLQFLQQGAAQFVFHTSNDGSRFEFSTYPGPLPAFDITRTTRIVDFANRPTVGDRGVVTLSTTGPSSVYVIPRYYSTDGKIYESGLTDDSVTVTSIRPVIITPATEEPRALNLNNVWTKTIEMVFGRSNPKLPVFPATTPTYVKRWSIGVSAAGNDNNLPGSIYFARWTDDATFTFPFSISDSGALFNTSITSNSSITANAITIADAGIFKFIRFTGSTVTGFIGDDPLASPSNLLFQIKNAANSILECTDNGGFAVLCPLVNQGGISVGKRGGVAATESFEIYVEQSTNQPVGQSNSYTIGFSASVKSEKPASPGPTNPALSSGRMFGWTNTEDILMSRARDNEIPLNPATDRGFFYINALATIPTGTPTYRGLGACPVVFCKGDNSLYVYNGSWQKQAGSSSTGTVTTVAPVTVGKLTKWSTTTALTDSSVTETGSLLSTTLLFQSAGLTDTTLISKVFLYAPSTGRLTGITGAVGMIPILNSSLVPIASAFTEDSPGGTNNFAIISKRTYVRPPVGAVADLHIDSSANQPGSLIFVRASSTDYWELRHDAGSTQVMPLTLLKATVPVWQISTGGIFDFKFNPTVNGNAIWHAGNSDFQAHDLDLDSIAGLPGTTGYLRKVAANSWTLDTTTHTTGSGLGIKLARWNAASGVSTSALTDSAWTDALTETEYTGQFVRVRQIGANNAELQISASNFNGAANNCEARLCFLRNDGLANTTSGVRRFVFWMASNASESVTGTTTKTGSNLILSRYYDSGTLITDPTTPAGYAGKVFEVVRDTGVVQFSYTPKVLSGAALQNVVLENRKVASHLLTSTPSNVYSSVEVVPGTDGATDLSADRTLRLRGEGIGPAVSQYYGTNAAGTRGYHNHPAAAAQTLIYRRKVTWTFVHAFAPDAKDTEIIPDTSMPGYTATSNDLIFIEDDNDSTSLVAGNLAVLWVYAQPSSPGSVHVRLWNTGTVGTVPIGKVMTVVMTVFRTTLPYP